MEKLKNMAVLIDADNASPNTIDIVFKEIEKLGAIRCKKIYGDWGQTNLSGWQAAILRFAIDPMQQFAYVKGKNATDIALVIEAMDLLHSGEFDGFCLISSDSDFASLAVRIRKNNVKVFGFGKASAVVSFKHACDQFFAVEDLVETVAKTDTENTKKITPIPTNQLKGDTKLMNALRDVVAQTLDKTDDNWSNYGEIVKIYKRKYPTLTHENYGYEKLIHLIKATELFEIKDKKIDGNYRLFVKDKKSRDELSTPIKFSTKQLQAEKAFIQAIEELIKTNPKSENGWTNISYIASQLNQNDTIDIRQYGYAKFSDLMTAIRLFDIKKQNNGVYVKLKENKPQQKNPATQKTASTATLESQANQPLILNNQINISIESAQSVDAVLWRLTAHKKVRGDEDMIFYGQTVSENNSISLTVEPTEQQTWLSTFDCQLANQPNDIHRITFTLTHETAELPTNSPINVIINQQQQRLFEGSFLLTKGTAQSVLLFELIRVAEGWQFVQREQLVRGDLRKLCHALGIEVSDD